ncbi:HPr family phosphocarrier protein [Oceanospirillum linum]|uniref:HPr domain-containing protein n=1 Tax=Oceanospirillum linum TaxID=966 RepID=A0A1T1H9T8_OCELI|nr:HPr family phosphocarrier protein [Oceanospirillum linum]OOV86477.1 hypothetical protein BTA35_0213320 [Oceanospirillum linum]SEG34589.1 phosphotransferase system HPr (HPr) family [Oleiphilus messinensis]SMP29498.1 HPr-like nitrogen-regulatory protein NPr [Oceanospirillum linum]
MAEFTVTVKNSKGFHLRPASKLLELASSFEGASITLRHHDSGRSADCRNMMALMMMSSPQGTVFHVEVNADDTQAPEIEAAITQLFAKGLGDGI